MQVRFIEQLSVLHALLQQPLKQPQLLVVAGDARVAVVETGIRVNQLRNLQCSRVQLRWQRRQWLRQRSLGERPKRVVESFVALRVLAIVLVYL